MTHRDAKFAMREAKASEAMAWLRANADRAVTEGSKEVSVSAQDLLDICSYVESLKAREKIAFAGKPLGYCHHQDIRDLLSHRSKGISIRASKGPKFAIRVYFTAELPPHIELDDDQIPMDTVQNASLAAEVS